MSYTAQELNRKITFREVQQTQDPETGDIIEEWVDLKSVFAKVEPLVGREFFAAQAVQAESITKFTSRFIDGINAAMRIAFDGVEYNIKSIQNIRSGNRETLIYATAL